jgi:mannose-1-phosphate guanylyltransferase
MEGAKKCWTVPVDFPWSDIGSWSALAEAVPGDASENHCRGQILTLDANGNILVSTGPVVSAVGIQDLVVVATRDAVLVVPKDQAQRVKDVVEALHEKGWEDVL